jgi:hypothetical protein
MLSCLIVIRVLAANLDHLAVTICSAILAHVVGAMRLPALLAWHQRWPFKRKMAAAVATAVARNFCLWYGTHDCMNSLYSYVS